MICLVATRTRLRHPLIGCILVERYRYGIGTLLMDQSQMNEELLSLVTGLKSDRRLDSFDEAATKLVIILRVLSLLGWEIHNIDEVEPEHLVEDTRVDYLLKHANKAMVFIEAKRVGEPLAGC